VITAPLDLQVMAAALRQGRLLNAASLGIGALTVLWWILRQVHGHDAGILWTCLVALGVAVALVQFYWALRVGLDAELLAAVGASAPDAAARDLDSSLVAVGLRSSAWLVSARGWDDRWRAMRRILLRQALCIPVQLALLAAAGWAA